MILVVGGTGRLGTLVVRRLVASGHRVRVLTRGPARGAHLVGPEVELVIGDLRDPPTLAPAVMGVDTVVSAAHGFEGTGRDNPASVDRDGNANLVQATAEVGAAVVLVSIVGAAPDHPMELFRMKAAAEKTVRRSGCAWTVVRSAAFAELHLELMRQSAGDSGRPLVFGRGDNPVNFVSVIDVAAVVDLAVRNPGMRGRVLEVAGPANLTFNELAALAQRRLGTSDRKPRHIPRPVLRSLATTRHVINSRIARRAGAAVVLDTEDMALGAGPLRGAYPQVPCTVVTAAL